jgi:hypothetical protein
MFLRKNLRFLVVLKEFRIRNFTLKHPLSRRFLNFYHSKISQTNLANPKILKFSSVKKISKEFFLIPNLSFEAFKIKTN